MPATLYQATFTGPTSTGTAGSTTGATDVATVGTAGGLVDVTGGIWSVDSTGQLTGSQPTNAGNVSSCLIASNVPARQDQSETVRFTYPSAGTGVQVGVLGRITGSGGAQSCYWVSVRMGPIGAAPNKTAVYAEVAGAAGAIYGEILNVDGSGNAYNFIGGNQYDCKVSFIGINPTTITVAVTNVTSPGTAGFTHTLTDSTSALQVAGKMGLNVWTVYGNPMVASRLTIVDEGAASPPALYLTPSTASDADSGVVSLTATLTGSSAVLTATVAGAGTLSTANPTSGTPFSYTAAGTGTYTATVTVTDATDSLAQHCTISVAPGSSLAISPTTYPLGVVTPFTLTGTGTSLASTDVPVATGGVGVCFSNLSVGGQTITGWLNPGTFAGPLAIGDGNADGATVTVNAVAAVTANVVNNGDSLTAGNNGTGVGTNSATRLLTAAAGLGPAAQVINQGVAGQTITQMTAQLASSVNALYDPTKAVNILNAQGGHNDFYQGATPAQVQSRITSYVAAAKAAHPWLVVWSTELPAALAAYPANFDSLVATNNTWLRANWKSIGIDYLSDIAKDQRIGLAGSERNSTYFGPDLTHLTDAGYTIWGEYDLAAERALSGLGSLAGGATTPVATTATLLLLATGTAGAVGEWVVVFNGPAPSGGQAVSGMVGTSPYGPVTAAAGAYYASGTYTKPAAGTYTPTLVAAGLAANPGPNVVISAAPSNPVATAYTVAGIPASPVVGETYPVEIILNDPASIAGVVTPTAATGITWGAAASIAQGGVSGSTTATFTAPGSYTTTFTHAGLGFLGDPTPGASTATIGAGPTATAYSMSPLPANPVVGVAYPWVAELNNPAPAPGAIHPTPASGVGFGPDIAIAQGAACGQTTITFGAASAFSPATTHTGLGFAGDPAPASYTATNPSSSGVTLAQIANLLATSPITLPATAPAGWIDADQVTAAAVGKIQAGLSTYAGGVVAGVTAPVTVGTVNDKAGYALAANAIDAPTLTPAAVAKFNAGLFGPATVAAVTSSSAFQVTFSGSIPTAGSLPGLYCCPTSGSAFLGKIPIATATPLSGGTFALTFATPFAAAPATGDTAQVG